MESITEYRRKEGPPPFKDIQSKIDEKTHESNKSQFEFKHDCTSASFKDLINHRSSKLNQIKPRFEDTFKRVKVTSDLLDTVTTEKLITSAPDDFEK